MINPSWTRWIMASVAMHFAPVANGLNLPLLVDGIDERTTELIESNHAEVRVTGPFVQQQSRNVYLIEVDVNIILTNLMRQENAYDLQTWCGAFLEAAEGPISVFRWGNEAGDTQDFAFCLTTKNGKRDMIRVMHFGQATKVDRIRQSMVDVQYEAQVVT